MLLNSQTTIAKTEARLVLAQPHSPRPIQMLIRPNEAMAGVVNNKKMIWPGVLEKLSYLHTELDAGVRAIRDLPALGVEMICTAKEVVEGHEIVVRGLVAFPPQHKNRDICILGKLRLSLYEHGRILEMPSEGFEVMSFGDGRFRDRIVRLKDMGVSVVNGDGMGYRSSMKLGIVGRMDSLARGHAGRAVVSGRWALRPWGPAFVF